MRQARRCSRRTARELDQFCSCPDGIVPCKHIAATFYLLAEAFDDDPFLILRWRGRDREELLGRLRRLRSDGSVSEPIEQALPSAAGTALALNELVSPAPEVNRFWQPAAQLPPRPPVLSVEPDLLLRQLPLPDAALGGQALVDQLRTACERFGASGS